MTIGPHQKAPKPERRKPNKARDGFIERDLMSFADRDEIAALAKVYMENVAVISCSRDHATVYIKEGDHSITVWKYLNSEGSLELIKTVRGDGTLHFKSNDVYRFAFLRCKEAILACRMAQMERNERARANPSDRKKKQLAKQEIRLAQGSLKFLELHTNPKTTA